MRSTVAGENSLEAIRLAKAAGFGAIETDVRLSADGALVVMHDSTLNRTCLHADGTPLSEPVAVAGKTLRELRSDYILKAADTARRTRIPTLEEYLAECARNGLYTSSSRNSTTRRDGITATSSPRPTPHWDATATSSLQQPRERRHPPHRHRRRAADGHSLPDHVRTDRGAGRRHRGRQRHPLRRSGLLPSGRTGQGSGADVRIARRQVRAFRPDQPPRHRFRLDRFPGARLPRQGRLLAEYARADGFVLPASAGEGAIRLGEGQSIVRNGSCPPYPSAPSTWNWKPRQRPHRAGRPNLHARRPRQAHRHAPGAAPRRRTCPAHHGARRRDHPHGDTGEGRSIRTIMPHPARKQEERSIPPTSARGPADRRASFAGTKYYRP